MRRRGHASAGEHPASDGRPPSDDPRVKIIRARHEASASQPCLILCSNHDAARAIRQYATFISPLLMLGVHYDQNHCLKTGQVSRAVSQKWKSGEFPAVKSAWLMVGQLRANVGRRPIVRSALETHDKSAGAIPGRLGSFAQNASARGGRVRFYDRSRVIDRFHPATSDKIAGAKVGRSGSNSITRAKTQPAARATMQRVSIHRAEEVSFSPTTLKHIPAPGHAARAGQNDRSRSKACFAGGARGVVLRAADSSDFPDKPCAVKQPVPNCGALW